MLVLHCISAHEIAAAALAQDAATHDQCLQRLQCSQVQQRWRRLSTVARLWHCRWQLSLAPAARAATDDVIVSGTVNGSRRQR